MYTKTLFGMWLITINHCPALMYMYVYMCVSVCVSSKSGQFKKKKLFYGKMQSTWVSSLMYVCCTCVRVWTKWTWHRYFQNLLIYIIDRRVFLFLFKEHTTTRERSFPQSLPNVLLSTLNTNSPLLLFFKQTNKK